MTIAFRRVWLDAKNLRIFGVVENIYKHSHIRTGIVEGIFLRSKVTAEI